MKRSVLLLLALTVIAAIAAAGAPAAASTFLAMTPDELAAKADSVVEGRVVAVRSFWNPEHTAILTEADLEIDQTVVGDAAGVVTLRTFGGKVGNYVIVAHGFPTFRRGERLLLFLEPEQAGARKVLGYQQGQYRIRADAKGRAIAVPAFEGGATLLLPNGTTAPAPQAMPVEQLIDQVARAAERAGRPVNRER
jgi:hypothetical protein